MRHRNTAIALTCAALAALGGTLAGSLSTGAAESPIGVGIAQARHPAAARHATAHAARVIRGPRGFLGPRGFTGPQGKTGPAGPEGPPDAIAVPVTINWFDAANAAQYGTYGPVAVPSIGTLSVECDENAQQIVLIPSSSAGTRTVADVSTLQGEGTDGISSNQRDESYGTSSPIVIPLPVNGMIVGTFSVEPDYGAGGPGPNPVSFIFSSYDKLNGSDGSQDYCTVAGQLSENAAG